jgi:hypothetical protein
MRLPNLALTAVALAACQPVPPAPAAPRAATPVNASFGKTWDAAIDAFATRGISIETLDRSSGLIVPAGRAALGIAEARTMAPFSDCGKSAMGQLFPSSVKYNVIVRGDSTRSTVQVRAFFQLHQGADCSSTGLFESSTESSIKAKAEGGA